MDIDMKTQRAAEQRNAICCWVQMTKDELLEHEDYQNPGENSSVEKAKLIIRGFWWP